MNIDEYEEKLDRLFRDNARRVMEEKGISYRELERLTGISHATIHKYLRPNGNNRSEGGAKKARRISVSRATVLARALGTTVELLVGE